MADEGLGAMLTATCAGDRQAFHGLVAATRAGVWRLVRARTGTDTAAEDALQETFVAVWRSACGWRQEGSARAWIHGLARKQAARTWRRRAGEPAQPVPLHELGAQAGWGRDPEQIVGALEDGDRLHRALDALPEADREILTLCDLEGHSGPEAAEVLEITANAARVRLHRARLRLMAQLLQEDADA